MPRDGEYVNDTHNTISDGLYQALQNTPIPPSELLRNLHLYMPRMAFADLVYMVDLYRLQLEVPGCIAEFGVLWGKNLVLWHHMRTIFEPHNHTRKIVGFDTFKGFQSISESQDKDHSEAQEGDFDVSDNYDETLGNILSLHQSEGPIEHIDKFELVKGDICATLGNYLNENPATIFSLVYIDCNLYEPTFTILDKLIPDHVTQGTILAFDELCDSRFPGETIALKDTMTSMGLRLQRTPFSGRKSFAIIDDMV